ncbi:MAG: hypothetical protein K2M02_01625, partial [Duncaniella sp.]|nr:hypothetical protein [Duncaniella sp.]
REICIRERYYAVRHFAGVLTPGCEIVGYSGRDNSDLPALIVRDKDGRYAAAVANRTDEPRDVTLKMGRKYVNVTLKPHSFNSFVQ